jgi:hypothetical protein
MLKTWHGAAAVTSKVKGEEILQMDNVATEQVGARIAWFLAGAYPGGAKRKRMSRDFDVSPETCKGWLNGSRPAGRHFDAMVKRWGVSFLNFVYPRPMSPQSTLEMREIADRLARLEGMIGGEMVGSSDAQLASPESTEADGQSRESSDRAGRFHNRGSLPRAPHEALAAPVSAAHRPGANGTAEHVGRPDAAPEKGR